MSKTNGTAAPEEIDELKLMEKVTPEMAQEILRLSLQASVQSFVDDYETVQNKHSGARFVSIIQTQEGQIVLEVSHVIINDQIVRVFKR